MSYEESPAHFTVTGEYEAWIYGYCDPIPGPSAAAWWVAPVPKRDMVNEYIDSFPSARSESDNYRATVGAARRALAAIPNNSTLSIHSDLTSVVQGLNGFAERWRQNNWLKDGKKRNGWDIWEDIMRIKADRSIRIRADFIQVAPEYEMLKMMCISDVKQSQTFIEQYGEV